MNRETWKRGLGAIVGSALACGSIGSATASESHDDVDEQLGPVETNFELDLPPELAVLKDLVGIAELGMLIPQIPEDIDSPEDLDDATRAQLDAIRGRLQSNAITNGELAGAVTNLLGSIDVEALSNGIAQKIPGGESLLAGTGLAGLIGNTQQGIDTLALLAEVATIRFVTESNGIERSHFGLLNTPMLLDVDHRLGADVIATLRFAQNDDGSLGLELEVKRNKEVLRRTVGGLLGGLSGGRLGDSELADLPLDIRAVIDVPVAALTGGSAAPLQVELGFVSASGIPHNSLLEASIADVAGGDEAAASIALSTEEPTADFALVGSVGEENAETLAIDTLVDFSVALAPVPETLTLDARLGENLDLALTTSTPTTPTVAFDVAGKASGELTIDQLPPSLAIFIGEDEGSQRVSYQADAAIGELLAELSIVAGFDIEAALRQLPPAADLDFGDGSGIDIDLGGAQIGEIAFTLTDGPAPRNVGEGLNGAVLDLREGLMVGARFEGFQGLAFATDPSLGLDAQIVTDKPVIFDVDLDDGSFADVDFSGFPETVSLALDDSELLDVQYDASAAVDSLAISTNLGMPGLTASIAPMPGSLALCAAQDSNGCTGATAGNVIDASLDASEAITIDAFFCLAGNCAAPSQFVELAPLSFETLDLSANIEDSVINIPFIGEQRLENGKGQIFINTDDRPLEGDIFADLDGTEVAIVGNLRASNRQVNFDALRASINRSGQMSCNPLSVDVVVDGFAINSIPFVNLRDFLCTN